MRISKRKKIQENIMQLLTLDHSPLLPSERELAKRFGVNRLTVQRALEELREIGEIEKVAGRGFVPANARLASRSRKKKIGFPVWYQSLADVDWLRSPYSCEIIRGAQETLRREGFELDIQAVGNEDEISAAWARELVAEWAAIIRISPPDSMHGHSAFDEFAANTVFVDYGNNIRQNRISPDLAKATQLATETLLQGQAQRILYTGRAEDMRPANFARLVGIDQAIEGKHSIELISGNGGARMEDGYQVVLRMFKSGIKFDSILATTDYVAIGAIRACHELGFRVPEDVQVIGFSGFPIVNFVTPALTTIDLNIPEVGREAARMAVALVREDGHPQANKDLPVRLILGETTRVGFPPAVGQAAINHFPPQPTRANQQPQFSS